MFFKELAEILEKVEKTSATTEKIKILANSIKQLKRDEIEAAISLILGNIGKEWEERELNISYNTLLQCFSQFGIDVRKFEEIYKKTGDPGDTIRILWKDRKQISLLFTNIQLGVKDVYYTLRQISEITGSGSREKKMALLRGLLSQMSAVEVKLLTRIIVGDMRFGVSEGILESAIGLAFGIPKEEIERAHMLLGDLGLVAKIALEQGRTGVREVKVRPFNPIKPMLAEKAESIVDALEEHGFHSAFEFKFDGIRAQIHKFGDKVKIFSRRLKEITESFPEIVSLIKREVKAREAVLEGEIVAVKDNKILPFQELIKRLKRIKEKERYIEEIPVKLFLFDLLYLNGEMLIDKPYRERREKLREIAGKIELTPVLISKDPKEIESFFKKSIRMGNEGLVAKRLDSKYTPGKRGKLWLKIKKHLEPLDCVVIAAEWGHGRRKKWLSDYYLAVRDEKEERFFIIGKTFKGLSDEEMEEMTKKLLKLKIGERGRVVFVKPSIVVEVIYDEIQKSPKYKCGFALRFARINRIRWDKSPKDADTIQKVREIFKKQFERKERR